LAEDARGGGGPHTPKVDVGRAGGALGGGGGAGIGARGGGRFAADLGRDGFLPYTAGDQGCRNATRERLRSEASYERSPLSGDRGLSVTAATAATSGVITVASITAAAAAAAAVASPECERPRRSHSRIISDRSGSEPSSSSSTSPSESSDASCAGGDCGDGARGGGGDVGAAEVDCADCGLGNDDVALSSLGSRLRPAADCAHTSPTKSTGSSF
jgi:hypothetical protein